MKITPFPHQIEGLRRLQSESTFGLLWDMGTGKTKTVLDDLSLRIDAGDIKGPGLVFTTERNKANWVRQAPLHTGLTAIAPSGSSSERVKEIQRTEADIVVLNPESLVFLREYLISKSWPFVVVDESTTIKNHSAIRTKTACLLRTPIRRIMSGLPNPNGLHDLYSQFRFLDPFLFGKWYDFQDRYMRFIKVGGEAGFRKLLGYKNVEELYRLIAPLSMRVDEKVLGLPERTYMDIDIPLSGKVLKHYEEMRDDLHTWFGDGDEIKARLAITKILRLAQISGGLLQSGDRYEWIPDNPKAEACDEILEETLRGPNDKAVIFAHFVGEITELVKRYQRYNPLAIYGQLATKETDRAWQEFQTPGDDHRLMIANSKSGGLGIDLTAARTAIYYTRTYDLEAYEQSQKRLHRIGQEGTVRIIHLLGSIPKGKRNDGVPIDYSIHGVLQAKKRAAANFLTAIGGSAALRIVNEVLG